MTVEPCPTTTVTRGTSLQLSANASLSDNSVQEVTTQSNWVSSNRAAATVTGEGLVTALLDGMSTIRSVYKNIHGTCAFHVDDTPPSFSSIGGIVINEFRVRGPNGGNDEFIELHNDTTDPIAISGWSVKAAPRSFDLTTLVTVPAGVVLNPGCHYLLTRLAKIENYSGTVAGDQSFVGSVIDDGGIVVFRADGAIVDAVGMSYETWYEGFPLPTFGKPNLDRSYRRVGKDTDNNLADFIMANSSTPTNRGGQCSVDTP